MSAGAHHDSVQRIAIRLLLAVVLITGGCGKKGDPLAPLRLVPAAPSEVSVRQVGVEVQLNFVLPTTNLNGPGRIDLDRVEIYAMTVAPGVTPPNRDLLTKMHVVGAISVKPPPPPGERTEPEEPDKRPGPGDRVSFVEKLTAEKTKPEPIRSPAEAPSGARGAGPGGEAGRAGPGTPPADARVAGPEPPGAPAAAAAGTATPKPAEGAARPEAAQPQAPAAPGATAGPQTATPSAEPPSPYPVRVYSIRGVSRGGRSGQASSRVVVPIVPLPAPPTGLDARVAERAIALAWLPPVAEAGGPSIAFNVYRSASDPTPLNPSPLTAPAFEYPGVDFEKEQCFIVRAVEIVQKVSVESDPSAEKCVTARDTFPPAVPKGLSAVSPPGSIQLTWDANTEADLAGYKVLRADAAGDTLRPLTPELVRDASFSDPNVKTGVLYEYAIVAVDRIGNASAPSQRLSVTAR